MSMKHKSLHMMVIALFPLLLGNSPYPSSLPYLDFAYTPLEITVDEDDDTDYYYSTEVTNTGQGYIDLSTYVFYRQSNINDTTTVYLEHLDGEYLMPNGVFFLSFKRPLRTEDLLLKEVKGFVPLDSAMQVTINSEVRFDQGKQQYYVPVTYSEPLKHYYLALVHVTIDEQPLILETTTMNSQTVMFHHPLLQSIALNRLKVVSIILIRGHSRPLDTFNLFSIILIPVIILLVLMISLLFFVHLMKNKTKRSIV